MPGIQSPAQSTFPYRFGPYVLLQPLGRGGMGQVSLALAGSPGMETLCVVKRILPRLRGEPEFVQRFRDEAELSRRLSHPNLVQTQAVGQIDGELFIAQEFVEGHDLSEVCRRCSIDQISLPIDIVVHIVREVARGLAYAHDFEGLQLVHRDINPVNVRLTYTGDVKLLDFGLATSRAKTFFTEPGTNWGKRAFMAPEQLSSGPIDRRADLYVLGILLWESLTERELWTTLNHGVVVPPQGNHVAAVERMLNADIVPPSAFNAEISPELDRVVLKALARSPEDRFKSAGEFRAALGPLLPSSRDADVELGRLLTDMFDVEKERADRRAVIAAGRSLIEKAVPAVIPTVLSVEQPSANRTPGRPGETPASVAVGSSTDLGEVSRPMTMTPDVPRLKGRRVLVGGAAVCALIATAGIARQHGRRRAELEPPVVLNLAQPVPIPSVTPIPPPIATRTDAWALRPRPAREPPAEAKSAHDVPLRTIAKHDLRASAPARPVPRPAPSPSVTPAVRPTPELEPAALVSQASDAFQHRRFDDAIHLAEQAARAGAGAPAHVVLGNTYLATRKLADAEREYGDALSLAPDDASTRERLAIVREMRKREASQQP